MTFSDLFTMIQRQITWKWYNIQLYLQWPTNKKSYDLSFLAISMTLNDPYSQFQGHVVFWRWISEKRDDIHSFNEIPIGTNTCPTSQCHFKWSWVTLSADPRVCSARRQCTYQTAAFQSVKSYIHGGIYVPLHVISWPYLDIVSALTVGGHLLSLVRRCLTLCQMPDDLRDPAVSTSTFRQSLKTHLFSAYHAISTFSALGVSHVMRSINVRYLFTYFTYLRNWRMRPGSRDCNP